jgi:hypothetical protein
MARKTKAAAPRCLIRKREREPNYLAIDYEISR